MWFPQLPLDRLIRRQDVRLTGPFAISAELRNAWRITHSNDAARCAGIHAGLPLADARATLPDLLTEPGDLVREDLLLRALWRWADCLSPRVALDAPDGLLLDITGCAHLFQGERKMADHALSLLADMSITCQIGIGDTKGAARALARFGAGALSIAPAGQTGDALSALPISALGLDEKTVGDLARTGLTHISQLYQIKSAELARRYGLHLASALKTATGQAPDPITPKAAEPIYAARMTLPEPIGLLTDIEGVVERLAVAVCKRLEADQCGARQFVLIVRCVDTGDHPLRIGFATPCYEPAPILRQLAHPLGKLSIEFGADWFRLVAREVEPIRFRQSVIGDDVKRSDNRARLIETLGNRLGFDHVRVFRPCDSYVPEHEFEQVEAVYACAEPWDAPPRPRPIRLLKPAEFVRVEIGGRPPRKFVWRRLTYTAAHVAGPERLTPRWHIDADLRTRDYWTVHTEEGPRLWLVTYPAHSSDEWYVAGEFP